MFLMEIVLGQFSSLAAISVWNVVPLFKGVGVAMVLISAIVAVYLNVVSAWALFYLINSVSFSLPWSNCANSWSGLSRPNKYTVYPKRRVRPRGRDSTLASNPRHHL
ncbi:hypothetical protein Y032_0030g2089 [Ancylostoma ceylanicum]|nr:hypothetical protein Y032_0030g2089 [Ancylostoma ceylanicum]